LGKEYHLEISIPKTKVLPFHGKTPVRSKIVINNDPMQQVSHFWYLESVVSYKKDNDIETKPQRYEIICGTINRTLGQGRIMGFIGLRHFSSLGPFGDSKRIVGTTVYSRLSGLIEGERMHG
jgi:hypothetical protein